MRKGRKISAKPLYVLTAAKWFEVEEIKRKEKEKIITEKEQRKELREKAKQAKTTQKENKKLTQNKKINKNTKAEDVIAKDCKDTLKECQRKRKSGIRDTNNYNKKSKTNLKEHLCDKQTTQTETEDSETVNTKGTEDITKTEICNDIDMIKSKVLKPNENRIVLKPNENVNETDIVLEKTEKDKIKSKDIGKTKYDNVPAILLNNVISAKKIKILSIAPVPAQFINVKKKLFNDCDSKGSTTTARTAENKNDEINKSAVISKTDDLKTKSRKTIKLLSSLKKVNPIGRLPLPAKISSVSVKRHSVDKKPIFSEAKKIFERRATFRNDKELQDFINEQGD